VLIGLFAGLGASLLLGGLFSAGAMVAIPVQVGLADRWGTEALSDPIFYLFAAFALCFLPEWVRICATAPADFTDPRGSTPGSDR
jgi:hypothetical protein